MGSDVPDLEIKPNKNDLVDTTPRPQTLEAQGLEIQADVASRIVEAELGFLHYYALNQNSVDLLDSMADPSRMACFERMVRRKYQPGAFIVKKGSTGDTLYFLEGGTASAGDADRTLRSFDKGCVLGESIFVSSIKQAMRLGVVSSEASIWRFDVVAATECVFWELDVQTFVEVRCQYRFISAKQVCSTLLVV